MSVTIRSVEVSDIAEISTLEKACFSYNGYPPFFFRQAYDALGGFFLAAVDGDGGIAGYCLGGVNGRDQTGWVLSLAVRKNARRNGIGTGLMNALLARLSAAGAARANLTVEPDNTAAIAAYEKLGFRAIAKEPDYFGPGDARSVMEISLKTD